MIGIFDSGFGGLTVLRALTDAMPERRFLYLGDHAAAPYGNRHREEIYRLTQVSAQRLFARGCRLVVLACNTASASSLRRLQQEWLPIQYPDHRILGVLVPMVEAITGVPWMADLYQTALTDSDQRPSCAGRDASASLGYAPTPRALCARSNNAGVAGLRALNAPSQPVMSMAHHRLALPPQAPNDKVRTVAVFATQQTVLSNAYPIEIGKRAPNVTVVQQACPQLVSLIEAGAPHAALRPLVLRYVDALMDRMDGQKPEVAMLGCTHYPLIADLFAEALPRGTEILSQPNLVARSLAAYLARHPDLDDASHAPPATQFLTTGNAERTSALGSQFFGQPVVFQSVEETPAQCHVTIGKSNSLAGPTDKA
jgi:glutamate racemase